MLSGSCSGWLLDVLARWIWPVGLEEKLAVLPGKMQNTYLPEGRSVGTMP